MSPTSRILFLLLTVALSVASSSAQTPPAAGTPAFGSLGGGPDIINLANLNAHVAIPVIHKPGRGTNFTYDLSFDSSVWSPVSATGLSTWTPVANWGWRAITEAATGYVSDKTHSETCANPEPPPRLVHGAYWDTFVYHDAFGSPHPFNVTAQSGICGGGSEYGVALDGSGYTISFDTNGDGGFWINSSSGTLIIPAQTGSASFTDRNGNKLTVNSSGQFFDTLSSTTPVLTVAGSGTPASPLTYTYTAPSGANASYTMNFTNYTIATNFGVSGISEYKSSAAVPLVSSIVLPDNSQYSLTYENTPGSCTPYSGTTCVTARVKSITLPTGGTINYSYSGGNNGILSDGSAATVTRTTPDGTWIYSQVKNAGAASTTTITDPQNNQTVIQFQGIYETQRQAYQGSTSGPLLVTTNTCYNGSTSPCNSTAVTLPFTQRAVITTLPNNLQSKHVDSYNSFGGPTETDDYDYGSGAPGALLRKTTFTYAPLGAITAFRQTVTTYNGGGTVVSQTNYNYDETAVTATTGTPQHVSVTGSRGNLTSINYPVSGLTSHSTYYDTGTMNTSTDVNGAVTTFNYSSSSCGNSFPTSVNEPLSLSRFMTWNCTGGVQLTSVDENNQTVTTAYNDAYFWRPNVVTDQLNNQTSIGYATGGTVMTTSLEFNSNSSIVAVAHNFDGLGRSSFDQRYQSPGGQSFDTASNTYDANGRPYSTSLPCSVGAGSNCPPATPKTTQTYDALNRPLLTTDGGGGTVNYSYTGNDVIVAIGPAPSGENTKRRQLEYDALGRLTSVCELTGATGSGTCGQNSTQTGYWTKYTYDALGDLTGVTQNAQPGGTAQTRSYSFDAMSRLTSETNPESGSTTYAYDSDSTCGTSKGDLLKKTDAAGNVTCAAYDILHRVTSVTYPSGPYMSVTPMKVFYYDTSHFNTTYNTKGRLASAGTCANPTCAGPWITAEDFSYSARGELTDLYESTPHSTAYYHATQTYWANGVLAGLTGYIGSNVNYSAAWTPDGEGRVSSSYPVTGTTYNSSSQPTLVNFTWGDSDSYSYDANTGRMTQYQFNVNGQSDTGALTWNANSSLQKLVITDAFNSADNQTCNYAHDDMSRIASANCGSAASQTFSYDPFGNISKSGSPYSFQPTYNSATNRFATLPGATPSYDANGNVTYDGSHNYTWDADGNSVSIDSVGLTYDAFDRMVEQNRSGAYTQFMYSPTGFKMQILNGQTVAKNFVPLPGGGTAVYSGPTFTAVRHPDWLGSSRFASTPSRTMYSDTAYAPFGEPYAQAGAADLSFTGMNQDTVSGDYDFLYRPYSIQGRWPTPDPAGLAAVNPSNPQSWNRYAYVLNNPLAYIDPQGLTCYALLEDGSYTTTEIDGIDSAQDCKDAGDYGGIWLEVDSIVTVNADGSGDESSWTYWDSGGDWGYLPSDSFSWSQDAGNGNGSGGADNRTGNEVCKDYFLRNAHGGGDLVAKGVPNFSFISISSNLYQFVKATLLLEVAKGAPLVASWTYGKLLTTTGKNMMQYPGLADAGANMATRGAVLSTGAKGLAAGLAYASAGITGYETGADIAARWVCRDVQ